MNRKTKAACDFFLGIFLSVIFPSGSAAYEEIAVNNGATIRAGEVLDVNFDLKTK